MWTQQNRFIIFYFIFHKIREEDTLGLVKVILHVRVQGWKNSFSGGFLTEEKWTKGERRQEARSQSELSCASCLD